jgi:hypothetical protein
VVTHFHPETTSLDLDNSVVLSSDSRKMSGKNALSISLRELRIAKLDKRMKAKPCLHELEAYLAALSNSDNKRVSASLSKLLSDCAETPVSIDLLCHRLL